MNSETIEKHNFEMAKSVVEKRSILLINDNLDLSSYNGHLDILKFLIKNGADIHCWDDSPLRNASYRGHLEVVKFLIENGANIHACDDQSLITAIREEHYEVVKFLVENGANIHAQYNYALRLASECNNKRIIIYLVEMGGDFNVCRKDHKNMIKGIIKQKHLEVNKVLLKSTNMYPDVINIVKEYINVV